MNNTTFAAPDLHEDFVGFDYPSYGAAEPADPRARAHVSQDTHRLVLPYPISANRYWRTYMPKGFKAPVTTLSAEAKEYKREVAIRAKQQGVTSPIAGRVCVVFTLYPHRPLDWQKRMRKNGDSWDDTVQCLDLDNAQKVALDALKNIAFGDDSWVREISARRAEPDEFGARLLVEVVAIPSATPQIDLFAGSQEAAR